VRTHFLFLCSRASQSKSSIFATDAGTLGFAVLRRPQTAAARRRVLCRRSARGLNLILRNQSLFLK